MSCSISKWAIWFVAPACIATVCAASVVRAQQKSIAPAAAAQSVAGEAAAKPPSVPIVIADEPKAIDPVTLVPEKLAAPATAEFKGTSLTDVVKWIREQKNIGVTLDAKALADANILLSEPVTDRLANEPLYLLLDRLRALGLGWFMQDSALHVTTREVAEAQLTTMPYNLGDLIDIGYDGVALQQSLTSVTEPTSWDENGGPGSIVLLGDVLFVRNSAAVQREVAGLLAALRMHGRQTMTADAPQNAVLRKKLEQNLTVKFRELPLVDAVAEVASKAQADIRVDHSALQAAGVRERLPVSLELADQKLKVVLGALLNEHNLTWILRDGAVWITSQDVADVTIKTAVYDVRDLCRDMGESNSLKDAIESQAKGPWDSNGGVGAIDFPLAGVMVVSQTEDQLAEVLSLLENYRTALRASKPRKRAQDDPKELITRYYRMQTGVAEDLTKHLPQLVRPETWKSPQQPNAQGTVLALASTVELRDAQGRNIVAEKSTGNETKNALAVENSVLVVRQMREVHEQIADLISKIEHGEDMIGGSGLGGGLGGGGGFGGGFFGVPAKSSAQGRPEQPVRTRQPARKPAATKKVPRQKDSSSGGRFGPSQ